MCTHCSKKTHNKSINGDRKIRVALFQALTLKRKYCMFKCLIVFALLSGGFAQAGDLPSSLYQIELNKKIDDIKGSKKTRMKDLYSINLLDKQLSEPLTRLLVKVNKKTNTIKQIIGEIDISKASCVYEAKKLKEKYEELFSLRFETREHKENIHYTKMKNKRILYVGCKSGKKKVVLRVSLANISKKQANPAISRMVNSPRKLLSAWSVNCENIKKSRWFALESQGDKRHMLTICAGSKCIPYPGFWKPFNIYNDKRVKWISETKMKVSNSDKDAGWEGYITFNRCIEY